MKADPLSKTIAFLRVPLKGLSPAPSHAGPYWVAAQLPPPWPGIWLLPLGHPKPPHILSPRPGSPEPLSRLMHLCEEDGLQGSLRVGRHQPPVLPRGRGASTQLRPRRAPHSGG